VVVATDIVISETIKFMRSLQNSELLLSMMERFTHFKAVPCMSKVTQNKVINFFNEFAHPGGPYFAPRNLRQTSIKVMNVMFPEGKEARRVVHSAFRLLHPYYWPSSLLNWVWT